MKKIVVLFTFFVAILFSSCNTNDAGFYKNIYINSDNLISIETKPAYATGDRLYIYANFPRKIPEQGKSTPVDLFRSTGGSTQISFSYYFEKQINATDWQIVPIDKSQLDIENGDAIVGDFINGFCNYNATEETYQYRIGFPLMTAGNYRLRFNYGGELGAVELSSLSSKSNLVAIITSNVAELGSNGYYSFTVN